jgi:hypothetical protein
VRIFRDPKKSPNWYVEWRDAEGRRHCESCGPQRRDAEQRAGRIKEELRLQREEAKRLARMARQDAAGGEAAAPAAAGGCDGSALQLQGLLRCAQVEVPITIRLEVPPELLTALKQALGEAGHR